MVEDSTKQLTTASAMHPPARETISLANLQDLIPIL